MKVRRELLSCERGEKKSGYSDTALFALWTAHLHHQWTASSLLAGASFTSRAHEELQLSSRTTDG